MSRFDHLGKGLNLKDKSTPVTLAYSMSTFMQAKSGTNDRIKGAYVDGRRVGALTGGTTVNFDTDIRLMLGLFTYEYAQAAVYSAADVLYKVLCRAVDLAPFWLDGVSTKGGHVRRRPSREGIHLRESGVVTLGSVDALTPVVLAGMYPTATADVGGGSAFVTSDNVKKFYSRSAGDVVDVDRLRKRGGSGLNMNVSFHRISPDGFDVAMWTHENLDLSFLVPGTQPKYLETAFEEIDVKSELSRLLAVELKLISERARGTGVDKRSQDMINQKLHDTIRGRGEK